VVVKLTSGMLPRHRSSHELERASHELALKLLRANAALRLKQLHVEKLEILVRERSERIDQLNSELEQSRAQVRRLDLQNEILVAMIAAPPPHDPALLSAK